MVRAFCHGKWTEETEEAEILDVPLRRSFMWLVIVSGWVDGSVFPGRIVSSMFMLSDVFSEVLLIVLPDEIGYGLDELKDVPGELDFSWVSHESTPLGFSP
jgi:hypothetical protein